MVDNDTFYTQIYKFVLNKMQYIILKYILKQNNNVMKHLKRRVG